MECTSVHSYVYIRDLLLVTSNNPEVVLSLCMITCNVIGSIAS